ncbi:hypothetical protein D3C80_2069190 [compost metagenome]
MGGKLRQRLRLGGQGNVAGLRVFGRRRGFAVERHSHAGTRAGLRFQKPFGGELLKGGQHRSSGKLQCARQDPR